MAIVSEHGVGRSVFPVKASLARPDNLESPRAGRGVKAILVVT
jgi:hypothetical protein